jgi:serine protease
MESMRPIVTLTSLSLCMLVATQIGAAEYNGAKTRPLVDAQPAVERFIVKLRASSELSVQAVTGNGESANTPAAARQRISTLASRARVTVNEVHAIGPRMHVMQVSPVAGNVSGTEMLTRLSADSDVEYVVPDRPVHVHATSNDPLATGQWYLQAPLANTPSAINAPAAWDTSKGGAGVVIAVIDSGMRFEHPDLMRAAQGGRLLPGYDFVSTSFRGNDGEGRDPNASDPGDWVDATDGCGSASDSSWHGMRVAGIIGALTNNSVGVAGINWNGFILPVRVTGKCGGFNSDVLAGLNWAAGAHIDGVPDNKNPAPVLNVSLGAEGACDKASADVTSTLSAAGVLIVVSAGNEGGPVDALANCPGAMGIAGLRAAGTKSNFSNLGPEIALSAPGGNCINTTAGGPCLFSIDTTSNAGATRATSSTYTDQINRNIGTSFAAPIVSGIAGLMIAVNGNLKATQLIKRMQDGASKPFPITSDTGTPPVCQVPTSTTPLECSCTTNTCGAGMANALGAVTEALRPIAAVMRPTGFTGGSSITFRGAGSAAACNHAISSTTGYAWTVTGTTGGAPSPAIVGANTTDATVIAPTSGTFTLRLTVTDDAGKTDFTDIVVSSTGTTSSAPANAGSNACPTPLSVPQTIGTISVASSSSAFTFTRTGDTTVVLPVTIALSGNAINGTDYQSVGPSIAFAAGASTATLALTPTDSGSAKTVTVALEAGGSYDLASPTTATLTFPTMSPTPPPASPAPESSGGGGALDALTLMGLALALLASLTRTRSSAGKPRRAAVRGR